MSALPFPIVNGPHSKSGNVLCAASPHQILVPGSLSWFFLNNSRKRDSSFCALKCGYYFTQWSVNNGAMQFEKGENVLFNRSANNFIFLPTPHIHVLQKTSNSSSQCTLSKGLKMQAILYI